MQKTTTATTTATSNTISLQQLIAQQQTNSNTAQYTNYTSKTALLNANVLTKQQAQLIAQLKNCFSFALHNTKTFLVITMYYNSTKSYSYLALNLNTLTATQHTSIKHAKQTVAQQTTNSVKQ